MGDTQPERRQPYPSQGERPQRKSAPLTHCTQLLTAGTGRQELGVVQATADSGFVKIAQVNECSRQNPTPSNPTLPPFALSFR